jgi:hypothetical protein
MVRFFFLQTNVMSLLTRLYLFFYGIHSHHHHIDAFPIFYYAITGHLLDGVLHTHGGDFSSRRMDRVSDPKTTTPSGGVCGEQLRPAVKEMLLRNGDDASGFVGLV